LYLPHEAGVPALGIGGGSEEIDRALDEGILGDFAAARSIVEV